VLVGLTLQTRPHEIYRALIEATAFGTRQIVNAFTSKGIAIDEIFACGGLAQKNPLLMQIYADILQRPIEVAAVAEASAFGAAMFAAVAAGIHKDIHEAAAKIAPKPKKIYKPDPKNRAVYDSLFEQYNQLHDLFGRDPNSVLKKLLRIRREVR
jgi:L-ribulokinase